MLWLPTTRGPTWVVLSSGVFLLPTFSNLSPAPCGSHCPLPNSNAQLMPFYNIFFRVALSTQLDFQMTHYPFPCYMICFGKSFYTHEDNGPGAHFSLPQCNNFHRVACSIPATNVKHMASVLPLVKCNILLGLYSTEGKLAG